MGYEEVSKKSQIRRFLDSNWPTASLLRRMTLLSRFSDSSWAYLTRKKIQDDSITASWRSTLSKVISARYPDFPNWSLTKTNFQYRGVVNFERVDLEDPAIEYFQIFFLVRYYVTKLSENVIFRGIGREVTSRGRFKRKTHWMQAVFLELFIFFCAPEARFSPKIPFYP